MERVRIQHLEPPAAAQVQAAVGSHHIVLVGSIPSGWAPPPALARLLRRYDTLDGCVLEARIDSPELAHCLPGERRASPIRDMALVALASGAPELRALLWSGELSGVHQQIELLTEQLPTATVLLADLAAEIRDLETGWADRAVAHLKRWQPTLRTGHQIAYLDLPVPTFDPWGRPAPLTRHHEELQQLMWRLGQVDVALFGWTGYASGLRRHGWRSAAAAAAGLLAKSRNDPSAELIDRLATLPAGRRFRASRGEELAAGGAWRVVLPEEMAPFVNGVSVHRDMDVVRFDGQSTLRPDWSIPALRTVRFIHYRLLEAARMFVFRPATKAEASGLARALRGAVADLVTKGILVGPEPGAPPSVQVAADLLNGPSLAATVAARLRPWGRTFDLRFRLSGGTVATEQGAE